MIRNSGNTRADEMVLKFREVLKETERLESGDLWEYQKNLLTPLLLHARKHSPYYKKRLDVVFNGDEIDFDRWREIPVLTRAEAQKNETRLHAAMVPPHLGAIKESETSGSMGRPLRFFSNDLMDVAALAMTDRLYRWWEFDGSRTMINFVPPRLKLRNPDETVTHGWCSGHLDGLNVMRHSEGDIDTHVDWLVEKRPVYMVSYPSMIRALAERTIDRGIDLRIKKIISRGWVVADDVWSLCRQAFGASLIDQYGANEIGQVACQCPNCGDYHVNSEAVLVEVLDDEWRPVKPGKTGRVVLTAFYNYAMPFIRYEIGDFAKKSVAQDKCKTGLPRMARFTGRYRNNFTLRDGRLIFPNPPMSGFRKFFSYSQIQVVQTDYDRLEVRHVPASGTREADVAGLEQWLQKELDPDFKVSLVAVDDIPALPSGKYEDFVSVVTRKAG